MRKRFIENRSAAACCCPHHRFSKFNLHTQKLLLSVLLLPRAPIHTQRGTLNSTRMVVVRASRNKEDTRKTRKNAKARASQLLSSLLMSPLAAKSWGGSKSKSKAYSQAFTLLHCTNKAGNTRSIHKTNEAWACFSRTPPIHPLHHHHRLASPSPRTIYRWSEASSFFFILSHHHTYTQGAIEGHTQPCPPTPHPLLPPRFHSIAGVLLPLLPAPLILRQQNK